MPTVKLPCYCATLRQATRALTAFYDAHLHPAGVRVTQFTILQALELLSKARIKDLEGTLAMDQTTLTRTMALLAKRRLIEVVERPSGREKCWGLTSAGRKALASAKPLWEGAQAEVRTRLGANDARALHGELFALAASFS